MQQSGSGTSLQCPECRALLRIRDPRHAPETFPCPDCDQSLQIEFVDDSSDQGAVLLQVARPVSFEEWNEDHAEDHSNEDDSTNEGPVAAESTESPAPLPVGIAALSDRWQRVWIRVPAWGRWPTARELTWAVSLALIVGLVSLYGPFDSGSAEATSDAAASGQEDAGDASAALPAEELLAAIPDPAEVLPADLPAKVAPHEPAAGADGLSEVPPAGVLDPEGNPPVPVDEPRPDGGVAAAPDAEPPVQQAELDAPLPADRPPVAAPKPELPAEPVVDVEAALALRLRSYQTAEPVPLRLLLLDLEEMSGVPFQLDDGAGQNTDWQDRTVMLDAVDITVGELLSRLANRAGLDVKTERSAIRVTPLPAADVSGPPVPQDPLSERTDAAPLSPENNAPGVRLE